MPMWEINTLGEQVPESEDATSSPRGLHTDTYQQCSSITLNDERLLQKEPFLFLGPLVYILQQHQCPFHPTQDDVFNPRLSPRLVHRCCFYLLSPTPWLLYLSCLLPLSLLVALAGCSVRSYFYRLQRRWKIGLQSSAAAITESIKAFLRFIFSEERRRRCFFALVNWLDGETELASNTTTIYEE